MIAFATLRPYELIMCSPIGAVPIIEIEFTTPEVMFLRVMALVIGELAVNVELILMFVRVNLSIVSSVR